MPLVGTNFYGTQVQRTPWDDAEAQRTGSRDAWNMAQHQNRWADKRQSGTNAFNWAMNQDTLDFNAWNGQRQDDRADSRSAASIEAQRRIAEMGYTHDATMFDKRTGVDDARDVRNWGRGEPYRKIELEQAGWRGEDRARSLADRKSQEDLDGLLAELAADPTMANAGVDDFMRSAQGKIAEANAARTASDPKAQKLRLPAQYLIDAIGKRTARRDATEQARRDRLAADAAGSNPAKRANARKLIASDPKLAGQIDTPETADEIPVNTNDPKIMDAIKAEVTNGSIRQMLNNTSRSAYAVDMNGRSEETSQALAQQLAQTVQGVSERLAAQTGYSARSIQQQIGTMLSQLDTTSGGNTASRIITSAIGLGLPELGERRSERAFAVDEALKVLGFGEIGE